MFGKNLRLRPNLAVQSLVSGGPARASAFSHAPRTGRYRKPKSMERRDSVDETQAQPKSRLGTALVGTKKAPCNQFTVGGCDAGSGIADTNSIFIADPAKLQIDAPAFGRELDGIIDEIRNGLEQEIAISTHAALSTCLDRQCHAFVFRDRFIEI